MLMTVSPTSPITTDPLLVGIEKHNESFDDESSGDMTEETMALSQTGSFRSLDFDTCISVEEGDSEDESVEEDEHEIHRYEEEESDCAEEEVDVEDQQYDDDDGECEETLEDENGAYEESQHDDDDSSCTSTIDSTSDEYFEPIQQPAAPFRKRPSLKQNFSIEDIPVSYEKRSWKSLAPPDYARAVSADSYFVREERPAPRRRRSVTFGQVQIRDYELTLGDNPSVSYGPPISLDWEYEEQESMDIDDYEIERSGNRRKMRHLILSYYQRKNILMHTYGHSEEEFKAAKKEAKSIKRQRALTKTLLQFSKVEEVVQSAGRKARRFSVSKKSKPALKRSISV